MIGGERNLWANVMRQAHTDQDDHFFWGPPSESIFEGLCQELGFCQHRIRKHLVEEGKICSKQAYWKAREGGYLRPILEPRYKGRQRFEEWLEDPMLGIVGWKAPDA